MSTGLLDKYKSTLAEFVSLRSISTDPQFKDEMEATCNWLERLLRELGFEVRQIQGKKTYPYLFARYSLSSAAKTALLYGHYDVVPAQKAEGWESDPFKLREANNRLYARGAIDNKGQLLIHLLSLAYLIEQKKLRYNIKIFLEGNEETGNEEISRIIRENKDLLECDFVILSDGEIVNDRPTIDISFRGGANLTLQYETAKNSLHSGIYGGAVPNAAEELSKLIAQLYTPQNLINIPDFYEDVDPPSEEELKHNRSLKFNQKEFTQKTGVKELTLEPGLDFYTQTGLRPMLTVTTLHSGYTGEGYRNAIPHRSLAKINFRFVPSQKPQKEIAKFKRFVAEKTPPFVRYSFSEDGFWPPIKLNPQFPELKRAASLLKEIYSQEVVYHHVGGSIPVIVDFKTILGVEVISVSLANADGNMHAANENFRTDLIEKGLAFSQRFFSS